MWKVILLVMGLLLAYFFVPRYDLLRRDGMLSDNYEMVHEGYWRETECREAGREFEAGFRCIRRTAWHDLMGRRSAYVKERSAE